MFVRLGRERKKQRTVLVAGEYKLLAGQETRFQITLECSGVVGLGGNWRWPIGFQFRCQLKIV